MCSDILRQDSMCADAVYVRGLCLYYQDNVEKAFQHFKQVLVFAPDHTKAREIYKVLTVYIVPEDEFLGYHFYLRSVLF